MIFDYYVAGYFSTDSTIMNDEVIHGSDMNGCYPLEYGIIGLCGHYINDSGYFTIKEGNDFNTIKTQIQQETVKCNACCQFLCGRM